MKLFYLFIFCLCLYPSLLKSQTNLVPNSSFEIGFPGEPPGISRLQYAIPWKNFETSDWWSSNPSLSNGIYDVTGTITVDLFLPVHNTLKVKQQIQGA